MNKKVLYVATVVKTHIMHFHIPYLKMLQECGWRTAVAARNDYENPSECSIPFCDEYFDVAFERAPFRYENLKAYRQLKRIIDEGNFDIVHCHTPVAAILTRLAARKARKCGTKVIYTAHGFHFFKGAPLLNWLVYFPVEWICSFMTDTLITINNEDYSIAKKHMHAQRIEKISGIGFDMKRYTIPTITKEKKRKELHLDNDEVVLLTVGELIPRKNHSVLIQALGRLMQQKPRKRISLLIVGSGEEAMQKALRDEALSCGVSEQVRLMGYRSDIPELLIASDIFCFPSKNEGLGLAAIEAMASGLPIITSNVQGINDYSIDGVTGFKCAPNDIEGFVDAIEKLVNDEVLRGKISDNVRTRVEAFDINYALASMKRIYEVGE